MTPFVGQIMLFGGTFAPRGWAFCHGQLLAIASNSALFSLLGTTYGGDGKTTFALPDLRGRVPMCMGQGPGLSNYKQGAKGGEESVTLTAAQMPSHQHALNGSTQAGAQPSPASATLGTYGTTVPPAGPYVNATPDAAMHQGTIGSTGGGQAHDNRQPYLVMNYCIALEGIFPSRS